MGQSATLYRIAKSDFLEIESIVKNAKLFEIAKAFETFDKTFEGIRFILSKKQEEGKKQLVDQIFYPSTFIGEEVDFDNFLENFDLGEEHINYNSPDTVSEIAAFLDTISIDEFKKLFDHKEMSQNGIYPEAAWNSEPSQSNAFSERGLAEEFVRLKNIYINARMNNDYVVSFVG